MSARLLLALIAVSPLGACAEQGDFPSLLPRPHELQKGAPEAPPDPVPAVAAQDAELAARITALLGQAQEGEQAFQAGREAAAAAIAQAGAAGSESWIVAQQALSRLEAARAPTVTALAELDALALARTDGAEVDLAAIAAAVEQVGAIAAAQRAEIERLSALLQPV